MKWNTRFIKSLATAVIAAQVLYPSTSFAVLSIYNAPLYVNASIKASVMLDISKDNQLYYKAFSDYSDLDGIVDANGNTGLETTYTHGVDYYGYFDSYKCYDYNSGSGRFEPRTAQVHNKALPPNDPANLAAKYCAGNWSGNFLNWVTMSRMDAVRKLLYGGFRRVDGVVGADTVLERSFIPTDAHSWAKYYSGADMNRLTPYTPPTTPVLYSSISSLEVLPPAFNVGITRSGTTATVTTLTPHNYNIGQTVNIFGALNDTNYNGLKVILATPTANSFTFTIVNTAATPATGKINVYPRQTAVVTGVTGYPLLAGDQVEFRNGGGTNVILASVVTSTGGSSPTVVIEDSGAVGSGVYTTWNVVNLNSTGMSFCNTTRAVGYSGTSQNLDASVYPPLMRVAKGNFALWSANERWQCQWREEQSNTQGSFNGGFLSNGNRTGQSGIAASAENPSNILHTSGIFDFSVRVQVCVPALLGEERCKRYPSGNYKPVGLLQIYGDINLINYGLFTGSYDKNISGGVLRKNVGSFNDEVNVNTDGRFVVPAAGGIVDTMNRLRIYGYRYSDGTYITTASATDDNCPFQIIEIVHSGAVTAQANEGNCSTWGNPMSEIFLESVRYLAGKTPTPAFRQSGSGKDNALGLKEATWVDPINNLNYCTPLNVLLFNTASPTYDEDQFAGMVDINASASAVALTNQVGDNEGITGGSYFVGNVGALVQDNCVPKVVTGLGTITGICPEAASYNGTYLMSGVALSAHTTRIRTDLTVPAPPPPPQVDPFKKALKVDTYGIALSPTVPKIEIPVPGLAGQKVVLMPAYRLDLGASRYGGGTIVDFKVVRQDLVAGTGRFYVNWDDSGFGGDYDQDVFGIIDYCIPNSVNGGCKVFPPNGVPFVNTDPNAVVITTDVIAAATANPQGFGYIISGTNQDGVHFHSGIYGFNYPPTPQVISSPGGANSFYTNVALDSLGVVGCTNCNISDSASSWVYTRVANASANVLQDPLYYAAKYGAFDDQDGNGLPTNSNKCEFDSKDANGNVVTPCNPATGADGTPDTFFYVTNPNALEAALDKAFVAILQNSSASSVAANSTSLRAGARIYQATFNPNSWTGDLVSYALNPTTGAIIQPAVWDAGQQMRPAPLGNLNASTRLVLTNKSTGRSGQGFRWANLDAAQQGFLNVNPSTLAVDGLGSARLDYLRGSDANEGSSSSAFRVRAASKLGDIVNSNPVFVGPPDAGYADPTYQTFRLNPVNAFRKSLVYVAANDGMLHGFCSDAFGGICPTAGMEAFAYIPSMVYPELNKLTMQGYQHKYYVDGSPTVTDAFVNGAWKTVLIGGLGAGGTGYYALDITNPDNFNEGNAGTTLMWELRRTDDPSGDLGVSLSQPVVVKMANGRFAAVFGNGYNSTNGNAAVYVAFLDGGAGSWTLGSDLIKIPLVGGPDNGASTPTVIDPNFDGVADAIYVGTLKGEMWKIDVSSSNPSNWSSGGNKTLLFTARDGSGNIQPITSAPEVTKHPQGGFVVLFGTGQYLQLADTVSPFLTQTFYGVRDNGYGTLTRSSLFPRTITQVTANFRSVSALTNSGTDRGWYVDLNISGERVVFQPTLFGGKVVFVTLIPSTSPCEAGGSSYLFEVDPVTGAPLPDPVYDVNGDGNIDPSDPNYSGRRSTVGITPNPTFIGGPSNGPVRGNPRKFLSGSTGNVEVVQNVAGPGGGRLSWRELLRD